MQRSDYFYPWQIRIPASVAPHFALFESLDPRFDRKLGPDEVPHAIYVANYSTAAPTCILLKKWVFSLKLEAALMSSGRTYTITYTNMLYYVMWMLALGVSRVVGLLLLKRQTVVG